MLNFKIIPLCISICLLSACVSSGNSYTLAQEQLDKETCIDVAQKSQNKWQHQSLNQIYASVPNKPSDGQKSYMHTLDRVLKVCGEMIKTRDDMSEYKTSLNSVENVENKIENTYVGEEKAVFLKRTGGRKICTRDRNDTEGTLLNFFYFQTATPNKSCLYQQTKDHIPLTAAQVTPDGVLVMATWAPGRIIYLYKDNESERSLADGSAIQPGYFVYAGNYPYTSVTGPRTVYSFRRIADPSKGMLFYDGR